MTEQHECRLADAPIGLFWYRDTLVLKTEYGNNKGRIDAYIVSSGEFFWGTQPQTIESQNNCLVCPVNDAEARLNEYETLKKATYALRHDLASWLSLARRQYKEMETNNPICPHLRGINETERLLNVELTKSADIPEGK